MRLTTYLMGALLAMASAAPGVLATGYLINVNNSGFGSNIFGGQGDTVDVGIGSAGDQCTDEDDVVDIGIMNREGYDCTDDPAQIDRCEAPEGESLFGTVTPLALGSTDTHPHRPHCSDDGDTIDIGVLNQEGAYEGDDEKEAFDCQEATFWEVALPPGQPGEAEDQEPLPQHGGDYNDGADVGVLNREFCDDRDAADVGVANCEWSDAHDGIDVGLLNVELVRDHGDVFDVSLFNAELPFDGPDHNGLDVGSPVLGEECSSEPGLPG